jgi:hypothetical protein
MSLSPLYDYVLNYRKKEDADYAVLIKIPVSKDGILENC